MDIRTKLILAFILTSLSSMALFGALTYFLSAELILGKFEGVTSGDKADVLLTQMRQLGLALSAFAILAGLILGTYMALPIRKLAETVDRIRHGELELRATVDGEDEVALLATSLNEFMDQLDRSSDIFQMAELRTLVIGRKADDVHWLADLLCNWRMQAETANSIQRAQEVIQAAQHLDDPIRLVVLDESVLNDDGFKFIEELDQREVGHHYPSIILANDPTTLKVKLTISRCTAQVLAKPILASDLMNAIFAQMGVAFASVRTLPDVLLTRCSPRRILIAEDSLIIAKVTVGLLERWGHKVTVVEDGRQAVDAVQQSCFDLILMDLEMPVMGGLEACRIIRSVGEPRTSRTPIVALTAKASKEAREACMACGMNEYISKPVDPTILYRLVASYPCEDEQTNLVSADALNGGSSS